MNLTLLPLNVDLFQYLLKVSFRSKWRHEGPTVIGGSFCIST